MSRFWHLAKDLDDYERWTQADVLLYLRTIQLKASQTYSQQKYHDIISKKKW